mmetsp:Transcript_49018/g.138702  ORF Transcript_49018/g.138702 Transcript_49018/m.138702 type:complete len:247 (+) Transcript_49018:1038-1778(+)
MLVAAVTKSMWKLKSSSFSKSAGSIVANVAEPSASSSANRPCSTSSEFTSAPFASSPSSSSTVTLPFTYSGTVSRDTTPLIHCCERQSVRYSSTSCTFVGCTPSMAPIRLVVEIMNVQCVSLFGSYRAAVGKIFFSDQKGPLSTPSLITRASFGYTEVRSTILSRKRAWKRSKASCAHVSMLAPWAELRVLISMRTSSVAVAIALASSAFPLISSMNAPGSSVKTLARFTGLTKIASNWSRAHSMQ